MDIEDVEPDATLMITGPNGQIHGFEATDKIEEGLDVYEEENTLK